MEQGLGEKKSELVDAVSRLKLDDRVERLRGVRRPFQSGPFGRPSGGSRVGPGQRGPDRTYAPLLEIKRTNSRYPVRSDRARKAGTSPNAIQEQWARVEIVSPQDGVILEKKNIALGDIVDTNADLFKIADLSELVVWAYCFEEELPTYERLRRPVAWTVLLPSRPGRGVPRPARANWGGDRPDAAGDKA